MTSFSDSDSKMGLTAIVSSAASSSSAGAGVSASATSLLSPVGAGVGGIFVAAALIYLLAYLDLLDAVDVDPPVRTAIVSAIIPLFVVFAGIVTFRTLALL